MVCRIWQIIFAGPVRLSVTFVIPTFFIHLVNISLHLAPNHIYVSGWLKILHFCYFIIAPIILKCFFRKFIETLIVYRRRTLRRYRNYYWTGFSQRFVYVPPPPSLRCSSCLPALRLCILLTCSRSCHENASRNWDRVGFVLPPGMAYVQATVRQSFHSLATSTIPAQGKPRDPRAQSAKRKAVTNKAPDKLAT